MGRTPSVMEIGPYRLVRCIGEGGMGSVWEAEQTHPVRRQVAIKLIKGGTGSAEVASRFGAERQALALMDHPNIARILDAGTTSLGDPWFAMELVHGVPLSEYCHANQLGIRERLKIVCDVCAGVQHAHQKGIIHRDLKPANVLVITVDGRPIPKVIDFGLAKALDSTQQITEQTSQTMVGQVLGSLKYMSPEQAGLQGSNVDTRTDIFALGIILYELLTGSTPLEECLAGNDNVLRVLEAIRQLNPTRPSLRLRSMEKERQSRIAAQLNTDCGQLLSVLKGDLDWIVLRALEHEPNRRYPTVSGLQRDLERFLGNEPVEARPPSHAYRIRKFVGRNRVLVSAAALLSTSLLLGIVGTGWGMMAANVARVKESRRAEGERLAKLESQARLQQIEEGNDLLAGIFKDLDLLQIRADNEPLEGILGRRLVEAGQKLGLEAVGDEMTLAKLKNQLAESLLSLGFPAEAHALFDDAYRRREKSKGTNHPETMASLSGTAESLVRMGRPAEALPILEEVWERRKEVFGDSHPVTLETQNNLAETLRSTGRIDEAIGLAEDSVRQHETVYGRQSREFLVSLNNFAMSLQVAGRKKQALPLFQEVCDSSMQVLGEGHLNTLPAMNNLAVALEEDGQLDKAVVLYERGFKVALAKRGSKHPDSLRAAFNLADCYAKQDRTGDSLSMFEQFLPAMVERMGSNNPETLNALQRFTEVHVSADDPQRAVPALEQILAALESAGGGDQAAGQLCRQALAASYWSNGSLADAARMFEAILLRQQKDPGPQHRETASTMISLGVIKRDLGQLESAITLLQGAVDLVPEIPDLAYALPELRSACALAGQTERVTEMIGRDLEQARVQLAPRSLELAAALHAIGVDCLRIGNLDKARSLLREAYRIRHRLLPDDWRTFNTASVLGETLCRHALNESAEVNPDQSVMEEGQALMETGLSGLSDRLDRIPRVSRHNRVLEAVDRLIEVCELTQRPEAVEKWKAEKTALLNRLAPGQKVPVN